MTYPCFKGVKMLNSDLSYFIGFVMADGTFQEGSRNRGRITIEIKREDEQLLKDISNILPCNSYIRYRERTTNFKENHKSALLSIYNYDFRQFVKQYIPLGKKSDITYIPKDVSISDFLRGFIDGDGSIGFTVNDAPFVSIITSSEQFKQDYLDFLEKEFGIVKHLNRNKRDNVYNIVVFNEDAINLIKFLYKDCNLCLKRKYDNAMECLKWVRTVRKAGKRKPWDKEQDNYILTHSIEDSMKYLNRSEKSVKMRLIRLKHSNKY